MATIEKHIVVRGEHLVWVRTDAALHGPFSRPTYDQTVDDELLALAPTLDPVMDTFTITGEDGETIEGQL